MRIENETKSIRHASDKVARVCDLLLLTVSSDVADLSPESMPLAHGIYLWRFKEGNVPAYVGVALGKRGLRGRIIQQHIRSSYVQSVFRTRTAESKGVSPHEESVEFIKSHFTIAFLACPEENAPIINAAESLLIAALRPRFKKTRGYITSAGLVRTRLKT